MHSIVRPNLPDNPLGVVARIEGSVDGPIWVFYAAGDARPASSNERAWFKKEVSHA